MFAAYLQQYPKGTFAPLAKAKIAALTRKKVAVARPPKARPKPRTKPAVGTYSARRRPGDAFRDCPECPELVVIPPGWFKFYVLPIIIAFFTIN